MSQTWWRKLAWERMNSGAGRRSRSALGVESLEDRTTPTGILAAGSAPGAAPLVAVYDVTSRNQLFTFVPYDASFTGGVNVAVGDVNGDGTADIITGSGPGGGPLVKVFDGRNGAELSSFTAGDDSSRIGVSVATADFDGDGLADIVVGTMRKGQPLIQVLKFSDQSVIRGYTPFEGVTGVTVATGDVNGDGTPDVVAGAGAGGAPRVQVFSGTDDSVLMSFLAFESTFTGGVKVASGDLNGNGRADVVAAAGFLGGPRVQAFSGADAAVITNFFAYSDALRDGVSASVADSDNNGSLDLVTASGVNQTGLKAFNARTAAALTAPNFTGMVASASYDTTAPTATVSSTTTPTTKTTPIPFTVVFNQAVNNFAVGGITVTNGTAGNFAKADAKNYSFSVTPTADGAVTVTVIANAATDAAGNANTASAVVTRTFDSAGPTVTANARTTNSTLPVLTGTVSDSNAVVDVVVNGVTTRATNSGTTWSAALATAIPAGTYTFTATATDPAGNSASASNTLIIETTAPTVTVSSTAPEPTNTNPIPFQVTFSEDVTGFTQSDLVVSAGTVSNFTQVDAKTYTFSVTLTANAVVTVSVPASAATDTAGNQNTASAPFTRTFNGLVTTPSFETVALNPTNLSILDLTVRFSSPVTGFDGSDLTPTNGLVTAVTQIDARTYTFKFSPTADGPIAVTIPAGAATDAGGVATVAATYNNISDRTAPTAVLTADSPTGDNPINFTVTFAETVGALTGLGLTPTNGTVGTVTRLNDHTFRATVIPTTPGPVSLKTIVGAVQDSAGNATTGEFSKTVTYDPTLIPSPVISGITVDSGTAGDGVTNDTTPTVTGTATAGATVEVFKDSGSGPVSIGTAVATGGNWSFDITPALADGSYTITAKATASGGGTQSSSSLPRALVIDTTLPPSAVTGVTPATDTGTAGDGITSNAQPTITGTAEAGATVQIFSDDGTGPVSLGTATATGGTWSFAVVSALADHSYTVTAKATDVAGNVGAVSAGFTLVIDSAAPAAPTLALAAASDTGSSGTDGITRTTSPTFSGTAEAGATVELFGDSGSGPVSLGTVVATGGTWTITSSVLAEGTYSITAKATDTAGNVSPASTRVTVVIDTTAPAAPTIALDAASDTGTITTDGITGDDTPTFSGTAENGATVELFGDAGGGPVSLGTVVATGGTWSITSTTLASGTYTITAKATDVAGNVGPASTAVALEVTPTPP